MKKRIGFVTNSSSSSFIIGKKDDQTKTIESVYQIIRSFYKEYYKLIDEMARYVKKNTRLGVDYIMTDSGYWHFKFKNGHSWDDDNEKTCEFLKEKFGVDIWCCDVRDKWTEWVNCKTYKEYESYWLRLIGENKNTQAPFTITDFIENKRVKWLHHGGEYIDEPYSIDSTSDVLGWYYSYAEEAFRNTESCDTCNHYTWCDQEKCSKQKLFMVEEKIPEDKACLYLLGRVCIHSESGYIPEYVVEKLKSVSEYACNHMG